LQGNAGLLHGIFFFDPGAENVGLVNFQQALGFEVIDVVDDQSPLSISGIMPW
jgi:hypothetical protein